MKPRQLLIIATVATLCAGSASAAGRQCTIGSGGWGWRVFIDGKKVDSFLTCDDAVAMVQRFDKRGVCEADWVGADRYFVAHHSKNCSLYVLPHLLEKIRHSPSPELRAQVSDSTAIKKRLEKLQADDSSGETYAEYVHRYNAYMPPP